MKTVMKTTLVAVLAIVCHLAFSQEKAASKEESKRQLLVIHVDNVKPAKNAKYEALARELNLLMAKHSIKDFQYSMLKNDENEFLYVSPIAKMADLDKDPFASLKEKAGKEAVESIMDRLNGCITTHKTYIASYHPEASYKPEIKEGENYRVWDFWYYDLKKSEEAKALIKEWKALYEKANITTGYRTYSGGLGVEGPAYAFVSSAKGPAEHAAQMQEVKMKMGEEGEKLMERTQAITTRTKTVTGYYLPELSYIPPVPMASGN